MDNGYDGGETALVNLLATPSAKTKLMLGPRVLADCRRRLRELQGRPVDALMPSNRVELQKLKEFLKGVGGGDD